MSARNYLAFIVIIHAMCSSAAVAGPLEAARELAAEKYQGVEYKWNGKLVDGYTDCTQFMVHVLQEYFGSDRVSATGAVARKTKVQLGDVTPEELDALVEARDEGTSGVQHALVDAALGERVESVADAKPGDLVQYWYKKGGHWRGHSAIIESVSGTRVSIYGAHASMRGMNGCVGTHHEKIDLGPASGKYVYIVRPIRSSTSRVSKELLTIWVSAFIPKEVWASDGTLASVTVEKGPHTNKTALRTPWWAPGGDFLTDQRDFQPRVAASARMRAAFVIDLETGAILSQPHRCSMTHEIEPDTGEVICFARADSRDIEVEGITTQRVDGDLVTSFFLDAASNNPCFTWSPDIDFEIRFDVRISGSTREVEIGVEGVIDEFPAFESYAQLPGQRPVLLFSSSPDNGIDPNDLWDPFLTPPIKIDANSPIRLLRPEATASPVMAQETEALIDQLREIDAWRMDHLKRSGWLRLGEWMSRAVDEQPGMSPERAGRHIVRDRDFRAIVPEELEATFNKPMDLLGELARGPASAPSETNAEQPGEPVEIALEQAALESLMVFHTVARWLESDLFEDGYQDACLIDDEEERAETLVSVIEAALAREQQLRRQIAKAHRIVRANDEALSVLGVNKDLLKGLLDVIEPGYDGRAPDDVVRGALDPPLDAERVRAIAELESILVGVKIAADALGPQLAAMRSQLEQLLGTRYIDLAYPNRSNDQPFLRLRLLDTSRLTSEGARATLAGELMLCLPQDGVRVGNGSAVSVEEVPLGVTAFGLLLETGVDQCPIVRFDDLRPELSRFRVNKDQLTRALRRMGLPDQIGIDSDRLDVRVVAIDRVVVSVRLLPPSFGALDLEPLAASTVVRFEISREGVSFDSGRPEDGLKSLFASQIDQLRTGFESRLNAALSSGGFSAIERIYPADDNDWIEGSLSYVIDFRAPDFGGDGVLGSISGSMPDIGWSAKLQCVKTDDGWEFRVQPHMPPAALQTALRQMLADALLKPYLEALESEKKAAIEDLAGEYVTLDSVRWNTNPVGFGATLRFRVSMPALANGLPAIEIDRAVPLVVDLGKGDIVLDLSAFEGLSSELGSMFELFADALIERIKGRAIEELATRLKRQTIEIAGITGSIKSAEWESPRVRMRLKLTKGDFLVEVRDVWFIAPTFDPNEGFDLGQLDFSDAKVEPSLRELVSDALDIDTKWLRLSGERGLPDGIEFDVGVQIDALNTSIHCGRARLSLGSTGFDADFEDGISGALIAALNKFLEEHPIKIDEIGPIRDLRCEPVTDSSSAIAGIAVELKGNLVLPEPFDDFDLEASMRILPESGDPKISDDIGERVKDLVAEAIGTVDFAGFEFKPRVKNDEKPYGLIVGVSANMFETVKLEIDDLVITTDGVEMPGKVAGELPGVYPIGATGLVLVNAGFELVLGHAQRDPAGFWFVGDVTALSEGFERIAKVDCKAGTTFEGSREGVIDLVGTTVLVSFLPVFENTGEIDVRRAESRWDSRTVGLMRKVFATDQPTIVRGKKGEFEQGGGVRVLGVDVARANLIIDVPDAVIRADGMVSLPIAELLLDIEMSPDLKRMTADGVFDVSVAGWDIAGARIGVTPASAEMGFSLLGFSLRVITPGPFGITESLVHRAIMQIFDFDFSLKSLKNREIVISLIPPGQGADASDGRPPGNGDPAPESASPTPDNMAPSEPPPGDEQPDGQPPAQQRENYARKSESQPKLPRAPSKGTELFPRDVPDESEPPTGGVDNQVIAYQPGNARIGFERDETAERRLGESPLYVEVIQVGELRYRGHFSVSEKSMKHVTGKGERGVSMIIGSFNARDPSDEDPKIDVCRNGFEHGWLPYYLTMTGSNDLHVVGMFSRGSVTDLSDRASDAIRASSGADDLFKHLAQPDQRLTRGDLELIESFAMDALFEEFGTVEYLGDLDAKEVDVLEDISIRREESYVLRREVPDSDPEIILLSRKGAEVQFEVDGFISRSLGLNELEPADLEQQLLPPRVDHGTFLLLGALDGGHRIGTIAATPDVGAFLFLSNDGQKRLFVLDGDEPLRSLDAENWSVSHISIDRGYFRRGSKIEGVFLASLTPEWDSVRLDVSSLGDHHVVFSRNASEPGDDWSILLLYETEEGVLELGPYLGGDLEKEYKGWIERRQIRNPKYDDLSTPESRVWLAEQVFQDEEAWRVAWVSNPLLLISQTRRETE